MQVGIIETLLKYKPKQSKLRQIFMKEKTISEIKQMTKKQIENEFDVLNSATISSKYFNLNHQDMNRYIDIFAYQHSRVKINSINDYYINANQMRSLVDGNIYAIFSQAPIPYFDNFWEAVYYKNVNLVIMLCSFFDPHRGKQSQQYWPSEGQESIFSSGKIQVKNIKSNKEDNELNINTFQMIGKEGIKNLTHYHWTGWKDLHKPKDNNLKIFQDLLKICLDNINKQQLFWIHCSAGIGRTGTLGGVIEAIRLEDKFKKFSIFQIVQNMRKYRYHSVQTCEQYMFLYQYLTCRFK